MYVVIALDYLYKFHSGMCLVKFCIFFFFQGRRDLNAVVHCYGEGQCTVNINPSTTAGDVSIHSMTQINPQPLLNENELQKLF